MREKQERQQHCARDFALQRSNIGQRSKGQMGDLSHKIGTTLQPVFYQQKIGTRLQAREIKPPIVNHQCIVYSFTCDLCDSGYVGYTTNVELKNSVIGKHFSSTHGDTSLLKASQFCILKRCQGKYDCFVHKMLFIKTRLVDYNKNQHF